MRRFKAISYGTVTLLMLIGLGAVITGLAFVFKPEGTGLGMTVDLLKDSPFEDFFIPGLTLLVFNGILSLIVAYMVLVKNRFSGKATGVLGMVMLIWIAAQVYWIGWESWLQPLFLVIGLIEMGLGYYLNSMHIGNNRTYYRKSNHDSHAH